MVMMMKTANYRNLKRYVDSMYMVFECISGKMSNTFCLRFVINTEWYQEGKEE
jgi:hypothetical protein